MQKETAPFALRNRIKQALVLLIILSPLYTYIAIQSPEKPTITPRKTPQIDSTATPQPKKDSTTVAEFYR